MKRIFQHYEGTAEELGGVKLKGLKSLIDSESETQDVILFWLQAENSWFRVSIDGSYCGIDQYQTDESHYDNDDFVTYIHLDEWVKGLEIQKAEVTSSDLPEIMLNIEFTDNSQLILNCDENEICSLKKTIANKT